MFAKTRDDVKIYYESHGDPEAPCVIFAHGAGGNAASWWQQVPVFAQQYRVITFDHRAFARSACSADQFSVLQFENDALAIMDQEGIDKAALVCQSMGGWTGVRLSAFHPERVSCLVLANTPGAIPSEELLAQLHNLPTGADAPPVSSLAISAQFRKRDPQRACLYQAINDFTTTAPPISNIMHPEVFLNEAQLAAFSVPTLIISSDFDTLFPRALLEASAQKIGAETAHVKDSGHSSYFEQPEAFNAIVAEYLSRHCH
jgi:3-oxoadipate enol-lactonase